LLRSDGAKHHNKMWATIVTKIITN
jgi:hypothetical protein